MATELFIPKLGQTVEEVKLVHWLVADGAKVSQGQEILEVETDKATFPIESPTDGHLHIGPFPEGEVVPVLAVVAVIGGPDDCFEARRPSNPVPTTMSTPTPAAARAAVPPVAASVQEGSTFASPRARKLARETGVDLAQVRPTGGNGTRIVARDVEALAGSAPVAGVRVRERVPLTGVRGLIADNMARSVHTTARVTLLMEIDATALVELRTRHKDRLSHEWGFAPGYNDILVKLVAEGLRKFPYLNARLAADAIEWLEPVHIGLAVDTDRGLMVPVVRDADQKGLRQVGAEFRERIERVKAGRALPDELTGGTFTITNLGMYDVDAFTPVIRLPEAAILGVGRIAPKPAVRDGVIVIRQLWTLCLVFDHRLVDGAPAARFLQYLKQRIEGIVELP